MKILVYDDNPDFGGHQAMACHGIEALAADPCLEIVFMFNPANHKLADRLSGAGIPTCPAPRRFGAPQLQALAPDLVLCIQGDIAQSTKGIRAARKAGIECVSYIAIPHRMADMGAKLGALRDRINQRLLNQPDRYIAISESMKQLLIERGATKPIAIVPNGIPAPPASSHIPPPTSHMTLGLIGRIEFNQKQQDFMVRTFIDHPDVFGDCRLLIAGNGPDEEKLRRLIANKENISFLPWQEDVEAFYEQIDFLLLPSRYEGVPLVMLEALARGIPVLGSARDGMRDILPEAWTFEPENAQSLAKTFSRVRESWQSEIDALRQKIIAEHSLEKFKAGFRNAVCSSL
ncbi:MAG: glycosyltransferase family 4 protein [Verrucomicrobiota bacterium]